MDWMGEEDGLDIVKLVSGINSGTGGDLGPMGLGGVKP